MMDLRPYQAEGRTAVHAEWDGGHRKTMVVLPTGCGKTILFSAIASDQVQKGGRALILAHRGELLSQAADKLKKATGMDAALEKAEATSLGAPERITVGSIQSLAQQRRLERFPHDYYSTIIVDECHHILSDTYQRVLEHFPGANILGVTATADRGDKRQLGQYFDSLAFEYSLRQAIADKYLVPIVAQMVPLKVDLSDVGMSNGDYAAGDLGNALDPYLADVECDDRSDRMTVVMKDGTRFDVHVSVVEA